MSGIEVDPEVATLFNNMKLRSTNKYATFRIKDKKIVIVDELGEPCKTEEKEKDKECFDVLKATLKKEPRYILYDFGFTNKEGRKIGKLAFIFWCPEDCKIGDKMIYASTKDTVKKAFTGIGLEFQANDAGDMDYNEFHGDVEKKA
uniref:Cofilin n=1 Tax=Halisarca dujardinii TaxID=2583056 RepID=A0A9F1U429_HALDU|nr:cofilin [Halisarca dujardinii]